MQQEVETHRARPLARGAVDRYWWPTGSPIFGRDVLSVVAGDADGLQGIEETHVMSARHHPPSVEGLPVRLDPSDGGGDVTGDERVVIDDRDLVANLARCFGLGRKVFVEGGPPQGIAWDEEQHSDILAP